VSISPPTLHLLCEAGVPVVHLSLGHWFYGITAASGPRNAFDRAAQFAAAAEPARALALAKEFVSAKVQNQRTMLRRNASPSPDHALGAMAALIGRVEEAPTLDTLRGFEGAAAACYFGELGSMLRPPKHLDEDAPLQAFTFDFAARNRRPPCDPVNAMLSFGYALLAKESTVALMAVGLDPYWGFLHQPRHGRPALALDLMEEFRPLVVDSAVVTAVNTGMVTPTDFRRTGTACVLEPGGRKSFIRAYETRLDQLATHPVFDYRCSWRRLIALQAQVLARVLRGDIPRYRGMTTR
jgi:CRISPR-associated protein Cas1